jgi:hypothetical protein
MTGPQIAVFSLLGIGVVFGLLGIILGICKVRNLVFTLSGVVAFLALLGAYGTSGFAWDSAYAAPNDTHYLAGQAKLVANYANSLSTPTTAKRIIAQADRSWHYVEAGPYTNNLIGYGYHNFTLVSTSPATTLFRINAPYYGHGTACLVYTAATTNWTARPGKCLQATS